MRRRRKSIHECFVFFFIQQTWLHKWQAWLLTEHIKTWGREYWRWRRIRKLIFLWDLHRRCHKRWSLILGCQKWWQLGLIVLYLKWMRCCIVFVTVKRRSNHAFLVHEWMLGVIYERQLRWNAFALQLLIVLRWQAWRRNWSSLAVRWLKRCKTLLSTLSRKQHWSIWMKGLWCIADRKVLRERIVWASKIRQILSETVARVKWLKSIIGWSSKEFFLHFFHCTLDLMLACATSILRMIRKSA